MTASLDKTHALVEKLAQLEINSQESSQVLKAVARIGRFSDNEFELFAKACTPSQQVLVQRLREQAKAALIAVAGGKEALDAADIARRAKEEQLLQEVCGSDRYIVENLSYEERIDILTHAKKIVPFCRTKMAKLHLVEVIRNITKVEREASLVQFPKMLQMVQDQEILLLTLKTAVSQGSTGELVATLLTIPMSVWAQVLKRENIKQYLAAITRATPMIEVMKLTDQWDLQRIFDEAEMYTEDVIKAALPLLPYGKASSVSTILQHVAHAHPDDRERQVAFCVELLKPFTDRWYLIEEGFKICSSDIQTRCSQIVAKLKPGTPWNVLIDIHRMLTKHCEQLDRVQASIEYLIEAHTAEGLMVPLHNLEIDIALNRAMRSLHV